MTDISNQSGGIDINSQSTSIGGDAVGRDKITQQATHNYYGALPAQPRRAELPHQPYFFGREEELATIAEALDPESNGWGVLIDGPGGIGKTALAIRAGHLAPDNVYPTKIFLSAKIRELTPQGEQKLEDFMLPNYMALLAELARELGDEGIERIDPAERAREVRRLLENSHALLIIDNLETFDEKERERLFQFLKRLPRSCRAIITSRRRTDVAAEVVRLDRLSKEAALKLIANLAKRNRFLACAIDREREELYEITKGNPLLIEWIVAQLGRSRSNCRTVAEACNYLNNAPKDNDPLEYIFGDLVDTFTKYEMAVLGALAHFTIAAKTAWVVEVAGIPKSAAETALEDLSDRALIISDVQAESHLLLPLAAVFIRQARPEMVAQTGKRLTDHVYALAMENGYRAYDRFPMLESEWPSISASLPLFLRTHSSRLKSLCDALEYFLEFSGRWDERLNLDREAESLFFDAREIYAAGWRAYKMGWICYLRGQPDEVFDCAERAGKYWLDAGATRNAYVIRLKALGHLLKKDYTTAKSLYHEAIDLWRISDPMSNEVSLGLNGLAQVEHLAGEYALAERDYLEALRIADRVSPPDAVASIKGSLAKLNLDCENWVVAESMTRDALSQSEAVGRQELIAKDCYVLAVSLLKLGHSLDGLPYAQRAVEIFTKLRSPDLEDALAVLKECGG